MPTLSCCASKDCTDVASQSDLANWTLDAWARYYTDKDRSKVRNVISLEVSATPLGAQLDPPAVVAELDWVEKFWPAAQRGPFEYPKVQKYCLMSVAKCWTVSRSLLFERG
jgi:F-box/leucine-rich repeat protein 10/11